MLKFLVPAVLLALGVGAGVGAGLALRPDPAEPAKTAEAGPCGPAIPAHDPPGDGADHADPHGSGSMEYVKLNNQFVIPVLTRDAVESLVVLSLSIEIVAGNTETVYRHEPKLRDSFLQVLFDHANMGGFRGEFTNTNTLDVLRAALLEVARSVIGADVVGILITDIARQNV